MPANRYPSGPVDPTRVDLTEADEFLYWTTKFGCSPQQLIDALGSVGVDAAALDSYFETVRYVWPPSGTPSPDPVRDTPH